MPRFTQKPSSFDVVIDWEDEEVCLHVRWTPQADDAFACLFEPDRGEGARLRLDHGAVYDLLLRQTTGWEGVLDAEGQPVPFTREACSALFPLALKTRLIQRFITAALTFTSEALSNPT